MDTVRPLLEPVTWNTLDWLIAGLLVAALLYGYIQGLLGLAAGVAGYVTALFLAGRFTAPLVQWADGHFAVMARTAAYVGQHLRLPAELHRIPIGRVPPEQLAGSLGVLPLPPHHRLALAERIAGMAQTDPGRSVADAILHLIAGGLVSWGAFLIILTIAGWGIRVLVRHLSGWFDRLPLVGAVNRAAGAMLSFVTMLVTQSLLAGLVAPFLSLPAGQGLAMWMSRSVLAPYLLTAYDILTSWLFGQAVSFFLL